MLWTVPDLFTTIPDRAMAIYAHPADAEIASGGTIATWAAKGCAVALVVCTRGDKGSHDPDATPQSVAETRIDEVAAAARALGLAHFVVLDHLDGEIDNDLALRETLVTNIRAWRPNVILGHDPSAVFFGGGYINHRDHREVGFATLDAVSPGSASPLYFPDAGEPHSVATMLLSGTLEPDCYVDIDLAIEAKVQALQCHRSQLGATAAHVTDLVRSRAAEGQAVVGAPATESFRRISTR